MYQKVMNMQLNNFDKITVLKKAGSIVMTLGLQDLVNFHIVKENKNNNQLKNVF